MLSAPLGRAQRRSSWTPSPTWGSPALDSACRRREQCSSWWILLPIWCILAPDSACHRREQCSSWWILSPTWCILAPDSACHRREPCSSRWILPHPWCTPALDSACRRHEQRSSWWILSPTWCTPAPHNACRPREQCSSWWIPSPTWYTRLLTALAAAVSNAVVSGSFRTLGTFRLPTAPATAVSNAVVLAPCAHLVHPNCEQSLLERFALDDSPLSFARLPIVCPPRAVTAAVLSGNGEPLSPQRRGVGGQGSALMDTVQCAECTAWWCVAFPSCHHF